MKNYTITINENKATIELTGAPSGYRCKTEVEWDSEDKLVLLFNLICMNPNYGDLEKTLQINGEFKVKVKRFY